MAWAGDGPLRIGIPRAARAVAAASIFAGLALAGIGFAWLGWRHALTLALMSGTATCTAG